MVPATRLFAPRFRLPVIWTSLLLTLAFLLQPSPSLLACSMITPDYRALVGQDGSIVFVDPDAGDEFPGRLHLSTYTRQGVEKSSLDLDLDLVDGRLQPVGLDSQSRVWLAVTCQVGRRDGLCNQLVQLSPSGETLQTVPFVMEWPLTFDLFQDQVLKGKVEAGELRFFPYGGGEGESPLLRFALPGKIGDQPFQAYAWHLLPDGGAWIVGKVGEGRALGEIGLLRFDAEGELAAMATHAPAGTMLGPRTETGEPRLGPFTALAAGREGSLVAAQYGYGPDCRAYQDPSLAIFEADGSLRQIIPMENDARSLGVLDEEVIAAGMWGQVWRFDLEGEELASFALQLDGPVRGTKEADRLREMAAALTAESSLEQWRELLSWADYEKRREILAWMVEAGPEAFVGIPDRTWREVGEKLCGRHPLAAAAALRRFERSRGNNKTEWLPVLARCFEVAPASVLNHAETVALAKGRSTMETGAVFNAFGYPPAVLEVLWEKAGGERGTFAVSALIFAFAQSGQGFEDRLRGGQAEERALARRLILSSFVHLSPYEHHLDPVGAERARAALVERARAWAGSEDAGLAATGRLLLLGHGEVDLQEAWAGLSRDLHADPKLVPWAGAALGLLLRDRGDFRALSTSIRDGIVTLATASPQTVEGRWGSKIQPFHWLFSLAPERMLEELLHQASQEEAPVKTRRQLLEILVPKPWALTPVEMASLLEQPWLAEPHFLGQALQMLELAHQTLAESGAPLERKVVDAFRSLLDQAEERSLVLPLGYVGTTSLVSGLSEEEVRARVEESPLELGQWLWLLRQHGAWPALAGRLEGLLAEETLAVSAAQALAPLGHSEAMEILLAQGLGSWGAEGKLLLYGEEARRRLETLVFTDHPRLREGARAELSLFDPVDSPVSARIETEVEEGRVQGQAPEGGTLLFLARRGRLSLAHLRQFEDRIVESYTWNLALSRALLDWAAESPELQAELLPLQPLLHPSLSPAARAWRAAASGNS